jgi:hypothetical protein
MGLAPYAGFESQSDPALIEPPPASKDEVARWALEEENRSLRQNIHELKEVARTLERALRVAGKVLQPYLSR